MNSTHNKCGRQGGTLIEVALGVLVLAVLALGASMLYHQSWGQISVQRNRRAALVVANSRLEAMRASGYASIQPPAEDYQDYYLSAGGAPWLVGLSDPTEVVLVNGQNYPIETTVTYVDADPNDGIATFDYLAARVSVGYRRADPNDRVVLETLVSP